jgi:hypothetical protein
MYAQSEPVMLFLANEASVSGLEGLKMFLNLGHLGNLVNDGMSHSPGVFGDRVINFEEEENSRQKLR